jgi:hypothetical protein
MIPRDQFIPGIAYLYLAFPRSAQDVAIYSLQLGASRGRLDDGSACRTWLLAAACELIDFQEHNIMASNSSKRRKVHIVEAEVDEDLSDKEDIDETEMETANNFVEDDDEEEDEDSDDEEDDE